MEDKDKISEDFKDFDEEETTMPSVDEEFHNENKEDTQNSFENDIDELQKSIQNKYKDHFIQEDFPNEENINVPNLEQDETESLISDKETEDELSAPIEEFIENIKTKEEPTEIKEEISQWEELSENNSVVKKYIMYISKDFVPYIDSLNVDERMAYINDAIQMKIDSEDEKKKKIKKKKIKTHLILSILTFCIMTPFALFIVNKAIMATFENYKYSQENFEKLYKQRFEKDRAYMRSLEYNKELEKKLKSNN